MPWHGIGGPLRATHKMIRASVRLSLLLAERLQGQPDRLVPCFIKGGGITGSFPITVSKSDRVTQRINLPLSLVHAGLHVGQVTRPITAFLVNFVERVRV